MTFLELQQYVQNHLDDPKGVTLGKIKTWINRGLNDVYTRWDWDFAEVHDATLSLVANDDTYSLSSTFKRFIGDVVRDTTNETVIPIVNYRDFVKVFPAVDTTNDTGSLEVAYYAGLDSSGNRQLAFYPVPNASITVKYDYFKTPTSLTNDSDTPEIPSQHHLVLANYALWKYYESEENNTANYYKTLYEEDIDRMIKDAQDLTEGNETMGMPMGRKYRDYSSWYFNNRV